MHISLQVPGNRTNMCCNADGVSVRIGVKWHEYLQGHELSFALQVLGRLKTTCAETTGYCETGLAHTKALGQTYGTPKALTLLVDRYLDLDQGQPNADLAADLSTSARSAMLC